MEQATENQVQPRRDGWSFWRDEWRDTGPGGAQGVASGCRVSAGATYVGVAITVAAACLVNAFSVADDLARLGLPHRYWEPFVWEASSAVLIIALLALPRQAARLAAGFVSRPLRSGVVIAGLALTFSAVHVGGMVVLRDLTYAAVGAAYSFHWSASAVLYELRKDLFSFSIIAVTFWLIGPAFAKSAFATHIRITPDAMTPAPAKSDFAATGPAASPPAGSGGANVVAPSIEPAAEGGLWLRDGRTSILVDAGDILWIMSAGNYAEYVMATGRRHLVRTTLQAEAERLSKYGIARVHRTRLVNVKRIAAVCWRPSGDFDLRLDNGETVAGSRRYKASVAGVGA
jgi:DNA-binding LytR/AlgR family response regulator